MLAIIHITDRGATQGTVVWLLCMWPNSKLSLSKHSTCISRSSYPLIIVTLSERLFCPNATVEHAGDIPMASKSHAVVSASPELAFSNSVHSCDVVDTGRPFSAAANVVESERRARFLAGSSFCESSWRRPGLMDCGVAASRRRWSIPRATVWRAWDVSRYMSHVNTRKFFISGNRDKRARCMATPHSRQFSSKLSHKCCNKHLSQVRAEKRASNNNMLVKCFDFDPRKPPKTSFSSEVSRTAANNSSRTCEALAVTSKTVPSENPPTCTR